jgi:hypothetical protein
MRVPTKPRTGRRRPRRVAQLDLSLLTERNAALMGAFLSRSRAACRVDLDCESSGSSEEAALVHTTSTVRCNLASAPCVGEPVASSSCDPVSSASLLGFADRM